MEQLRVNILSPTKQEFNGLNYWKGKKERYYRNAQSKPHSLHRAVWEYYNGKIPDGLAIDHIDRNADNNQIENLRLVTYSENNKNVSDHEKQRRRLHAAKIREKAKEWHASEKGKEWHASHGKTAYRDRKPIEKLCAHCGKKFITKDYAPNHRFCSANCKMRARTRRLQGLPEDAISTELEKTCVMCGATFYTHVKRAVTCSKKCRNKRTVALRNGTL